MISSYLCVLIQTLLVGCSFLSDSMYCVWRPLRKPCRQSGTYELPLCSANSSPHLPSLVVLTLWSWLCFPHSEGGYRAFLERPPGCLYIACSFASLGPGGGLYNLLYRDKRRWETLTGCSVCLCNKNNLFLGGVLMILLCEAQHWYSIAIMLVSENK